MEKLFFVIITRMHAEKGTRYDEYTSLWLRKEAEEHKVFRLKMSDVLLIHGYLTKYLTRKDSGDIVANEIRQAIDANDLKLGSYTQVYLLYHTQEGVELSEASVAAAFGSCKPDVGTFTDLEGGIDGKLNALNVHDDVIREIATCRSADAEKLAQLDLPVFRGVTGAAFSHLKHKIAQLFLPISVDLQGLQSVEGADRLAYAQEILDERGNHYCSTKFSNLKYLVAKVDDWKKSLAKEALPDGTCVWDFVRAFGIESHDLSKNLLVLSGLARGKNLPQQDPASRVLNYFEAIDRVCVAGHLMPALTREFEMDLWGERNQTTQKLGFHEWFARLNDTLDELRSELVERAKEKNQESGKLTG